MESINEKKDSREGRENNILHPVFHYLNVHLTEGINMYQISKLEK